MLEFLLPVLSFLFSFPSSSSWRWSNHKTCCGEVVTVSDWSDLSLPLKLDVVVWYCCLLHVVSCWMLDIVGFVVVWLVGCCCRCCLLFVVVAAAVVQSLNPRRSGDDGHDHQNLLPSGNLGNVESDFQMLNQKKKTARFFRGWRGKNSCLGGSTLWLPTETGKFDLNKYQYFNS